MKLTNTERQVLQLTSRGLKPKIIADKLGYSIHTIENILGRIYKKYDVHSCLEVVLRYLKENEQNSF